jgi:hypothetical protein
MKLRRRLGGVAFAASLLTAGACSELAPSEPTAPLAARGRPAEPRAEPAPPRDPRLRGECGGWEPAAELLRVAASLGDPARKAATLAELDAGPLGRRIDVLRAGLRLLDETAARACAARLEWRWIDGWECARCVDLLVEDVLRPGTEADWDRFRAYLGSADLPRLIAASPPLPWAHDPADVIGDAHEVARAADTSHWFDWVERPEPEISGPAWELYCKTMLQRDDGNRALVQRRLMADDGGRTPTGPGIPPMFRRFFGKALAGEKWEPDGWDQRWLRSVTPSAEDVDLLCDVVRRGAAGEPRDTALLLLGKLRDERSDTCLRELVAEGHGWDAWPALARRGDEAALAAIEEDATESRESLALLMEAAPVRARSLLEARLLGEDEAAAHALLDQLEDFVPLTSDGGWGTDPFDWRRTSFDGLATTALARPVSALRLARIALVVPGGRTRAMGRAVAEGLAPGDLGARDDWPRESDFESLAAFLETAAPDAFRAALRRIADARVTDRDRAIQWLALLGDVRAAAEYVAAADPTRPRVEALARMKGSEVRAKLEHLARAEMAGRRWDSSAVAALAVFHGLPQEAASALWEAPREAHKAVLDGRPVDALVLALQALLAAPPEQPYAHKSGLDAGDVGAVRDPRVKAWLEEVRSRRDLASYWYATGQLAAMGDPAARAETWAAFQAGRLRVVDDASPFVKTLGWDLPSTLPFWIEELRTNCCRATAAGRVLEHTLDFSWHDRGGLPRGTDRDRAREVWDAAGGRFVFSRIAGHWVPEPR